MLLCGHSQCEKCMIEMLQMKQNQLQCSICITQYSFTSIEDAKLKIAKNYALLSLMESSPIIERNAAIDKSLSQSQTNENVSSISCLFFIKFFMNSAEQDKLFEKQQYEQTIKIIENRAKVIGVKFINTRNKRKKKQLRERRREKV
eukprot:403338380